MYRAVAADQPLSGSRRRATSGASGRSKPIIRPSPGLESRGREGRLQLIAALRHGGQEAGLRHTSSTAFAAAADQGADGKVSRDAGSSNAAESRFATQAPDGRPAAEHLRNGHHRASRPDARAPERAGRRCRLVSSKITGRRAVAASRAAARTSGSSGWIPTRLIGSRRTAAVLSLPAASSAPVVRGRPGSPARAARRRLLGS